MDENDKPKYKAACDRHFPFDRKQNGDLVNLKNNKNYSRKSYPYELKRYFYKVMNSLRTQPDGSLTL